MLKYVILGVLALAIFGTGANAMSILPFGKVKTVNTVPMKEEKKERSIRCKGEIKLDDKNRVTGCTEGFYLDEESENVEERKATAKERFLGWLGSFRGILFWAVVASVAASCMGFGGLAATLWGNLFGTAIRMARSTFKGIQNFKRNGKDIHVPVKNKREEELYRAAYSQAKSDLIKEIQTEQRIAGVEHKVNKIRAKID